VDGTVDDVMVQSSWRHDALVPGRNTSQPGSAEEEAPDDHVLTCLLVQRSR